MNIYCGRKRVIIHLDMDAFYPSVEILDNPELKGKPVIVGGSANRGVVSSASYEARKFGVHSAQPISQALRLCPHGIFLPVRMERYKELSSMIFGIFRRFTPLVEPLSIDEAFLDVTGTERLLGDPVTVAKKIKKTVLAETGLTVSAGLAPSKFVAKIASDMNKPDGLTVVNAEGLEEFLDPLPIEKMWGAGRVTQEKMIRLGIRTFCDLKQYPAERLEKELGKHGTQMQRLAMGIDSREVETEHEVKSIGHEQTFSSDIDEIEHAKKELLALSMSTAARMRRSGISGITITLKVKYSDFKQITRSVTLDNPTNDGMKIYRTAIDLLETTETGTRPVRLLGVSVSGLNPEMNRQLSIFGEDNEVKKANNLNRAVDSLQERFGKKSVLPGRLLS